MLINLSIVLALAEVKFLEYIIYYTIKIIQRIIHYQNHLRLISWNNRCPNDTDLK